MTNLRIGISGVVIAAASAMMPPYQAPAPLSSPWESPRVSLTNQDPDVQRLLVLMAELGEVSLDAPEVAAWRRRPIDPPPPAISAQQARWQQHRREILVLLSTITYTNPADLDDGRVPTIEELKAFLLDPRIPIVSAALRTCMNATADEARAAARPPITALQDATLLLDAAERSPHLVSSGLLSVALRSVMQRALWERAGVYDEDPALMAAALGSRSGREAVELGLRHERAFSAHPLLRAVEQLPLDALRANLCPPLTIFHDDHHQPLPREDVIQRCRQWTQETDHTIAILTGAASDLHLTNTSQVSWNVTLMQALRSDLSDAEQRLGADLLRRRAQGEALTRGEIEGPCGTRIHWEATNPNHLRIELAPNSPLPSWVLNPDQWRTTARAPAPYPTSFTFLRRDLHLSTPQPPLGVQ